jgi:Protein of unknown function/Domain of unknown function (DUF1835)
LDFGNAIKSSDEDSSMVPPVLHVVFTPSGASLLQRALEEAGCDDRVVCLFDCLSFGPINPPDMSSRSKWVESELGGTDWDSVGLDTETFWHEALSPGCEKVAWFTRRSAMEYAGFLEWLWRAGDTPCEVVDLSDVRICRRNKDGSLRSPTLAIALGMLDPGTIRCHKLRELAEPLQAITRERYRSLWQRLRSENAPLRVIEGGELVSAPISFFDAQLMSYVTNDWQKVAKIIGKALVAENDDEAIQVGDKVLAARVDAMARSGRLEIQGKSALEMHNSLVRLPQ